MASPRATLTPILRRLSPRHAGDSTLSGLLSPRTPTKSVGNDPKNHNDTKLSPFNIDTPHRRRILNDGLPRQQHSVLGSGGYGTVYRASYKGEQVAAKILKREKFNDQTINAEKHAASLRHSNIIKVLGIEQGTAMSLITMELCGISLQDRLEETRLIPAERARIWKEIACALQFCHNAGVIHADVKPKNVLITADGLVKLTDFGSSILIADKIQNTTRLQGTPGYMAPEVVKGKMPTPESDIYSLGILAWQMLSRKIPFEGLHAHTILYLTGKGQRPKDENLEDDFKGKYMELYRKMWNEDMQSRPTLPLIIKTLNRLLNVDTSPKKNETG